MFLSRHVRVSEWIYNLIVAWISRKSLFETGAIYVWLQRDSNPQPFSLQASTQPFSQTGQLIFWKMVGSYKLCKFKKQPPELFYVKSYSYKFRNIHSKTPLLKSLFLIKLQAFTPVALLKKESTTGVLQYCRIFKNTYFKGHLQSAVSEICCILIFAFLVLQFCCK